MTADALMFELPHIHKDAGHVVVANAADGTEGIFAARYASEHKAPIYYVARDGAHMVDLAQVIRFEAPDMDNMGLMVGGIKRWEFGAYERERRRYHEAYGRPIVDWRTRTHVAGTWDGSHLRLFLDGLAIKSARVDEKLQPRGSLVIGGGGKRMVAGTGPEVFLNLLSYNRPGRSAALIGEGNGSLRTFALRRTKLQLTPFSRARGAANRSRRADRRRGTGPWR